MLLLRARLDVAGPGEPGEPGEQIDFREALRRIERGLNVPKDVEEQLLAAVLERLGPKDGGP